MRVFLLILLSLFLFSCGVETDSSSRSNTENIGDNNQDNNSSDNNSTDNNGTTVVVDDSSSSGFSKTDAQKDANACIINDTFQAISDSSFDPNAVADSLNGLQLASQYAYSADLEATKVALFYPTLGVTLLDEMVHIYEDNYRFSFDKAWSESSSSKVYIRTPKNSEGVYSCYCYDLSSLNGNTITTTKVYR